MTAHVLTCAEAHAITAVLHAVAHLDVHLDVDPAGVTHIRPTSALTTRQEVTVLRQVLAVTDSAVYDPTSTGGAA